MAAAYYLVACLVLLRSEVNGRWPRRDRLSDGWIGDTSHQARPSDHNPDWSQKPPPVRAIDVDKDGIDAMALVAAAIAHPSTNYVIYAGFIWSRAYGFRRRVYTGPNKHEHHVHISVLHTVAAETSTRPWLAPAPVPTVQEDDMPVTNAEMDEIARRTAQLVWDWAISGWDDPATNKLPAWQRLTAVHEITDRALWRWGNPLTEIRDRVIGVIPEQLSDLVSAIWTRKVAVRHPKTDAAEDLDLDLALGRAASVVSNLRGTTVLAGQEIPDPDALAAAIAAAVPTDLADRVVTALANRLTTRS